MKKRILIPLFLILSGFSLIADTYLYGEFIYNLNVDFRSDPFPGMTTDDFESKPGEEYEEEVIENLLEEARWVFSAMIYGLKITYTPSDISRSVEQFFEVELLAEIKRGDHRLVVYDTYLEDNLYHLFIRYSLDTYQNRRLE
ncbi:MAG: hypothetical protein JEY91_13995, partial [Spirochaetaceae bacterium]|nr:hypothetical protein [Spirochaetaceae bacterium]